MATVTLRSLLELNDYTEIVASVESNINRTKIDNAVILAGHVIPLSNKVSFHYLSSNGKVYSVTWFPLLNSYGYKQLTLV